MVGTDIFNGDWTRFCNSGPWVKEQNKCFSCWENSYFKKIFFTKRIHWEFSRFSPVSWGKSCIWGPKVPVSPMYKHSMQFELLREIGGSQNLERLFLRLFTCSLFCRGWSITLYQYQGTEVLALSVRQLCNLASKLPCFLKRKEN